MKDHLDKLFNELEGDLNAATKGDRAHRNLYALADDLMEMHHDLLEVGLVDVDRRDAGGRI
jgi:hypothetical protein